jgi:4'-phosphopantetheinyl transferase
VFPDDARRFTAARAALREVLATELGTQPAAVAFDYGVHGKPALARPWTGALAFNLSHSGEIALIALTRRGDVGVDIERHRDMAFQDGLVRRYFSAAENAAYFALPPAEREIRFFDLWTCKEALVKALGQGLSFPLKAFDVTLSGREGHLERLEQASGVDSGWCLTGFVPAEGYSAAVALRGRRCRVLPSDG